MNFATRPLLCIFAASAAFAGGSDVRISQVWGGGGITAGTPNADYVEIFNADAVSAVSLTGWSVQITSSAGETWSKIDLTGSIAARSYFLVQVSADSVLGTNFNADVTAALGASILTSSGGKIALVNNTTLLTGACPVGTASIVDFVGFGTAANCREGAGPADNAPGGSTTGPGATPYRRCDGLTDSNINRADFELRVPLPRNAASPANPGTGVALDGVANPASLPAGLSTTLSVTVRPCSGTSSGGLVNVDASSLGVGLIALVDSGGGVFTNSLAVGELVAPGTRDLPFTFADSQGRSGSGTIRVSVAPANDNCADGGEADVPSVTLGTTRGSSPDTDAITGLCGTSIGAGGGVWYTLAGTGNTIVVDTCDNAGLAQPYDTKLHVFCGVCGELTCVGGNDDGPSGCGTISGVARGSRVEFCSQLGATYRVLVSGFGPATGDFRLTVSDSGSPCSSGVACLPVGRCCIDTSCQIKTQGACSEIGGIYGGDGSECDSPEYAFDYAGPVLSIPDGDPLGVSLTISVADAAIIDQLRVSIDVAHSWIGDLRATLSNGTTTVTLFFDTGDPVGTGIGDSSNLDGSYRFFDAAFGDWWNAAAQGDSGFVVPPGDYKPSAALTGNLPSPSLSAFDGQPFAGLWELRLVDSQSGDIGSVRGFRIAGSQSQSNCGAECPAAGCELSDLDGNCTVNLNDLTLFLSSFGELGAGLPGDIDDDGDVDLNDLTAFLSQFGNECT